MYIKLLRNKNVRYYLIGGGVSRLGDVLAGMAFLFLAYNLTESAAHTTGMAIAETVPYLLFGLIGGVIADWVPKKRLIITLDIIRIPLILSVFLLDHFHVLTFTYLLLAGAMIQIIGCFFNPAHRAILPIITKAENRALANSLNDSFSRGVTVLSPILSIWLLSYGPIYFFLIDALTYLISVICLLHVHFTEQQQTVTKSLKGIFLAIADFYFWTKEKTTIKYLFIFTFIIVFFNTWVWQVGLLLALTDLTPKSEKIYSILQGLFGATVIITNIVLPYFIKKMNLTIYLLGSALWGIGITYFGLLYQTNHFFIGTVLVGIGLPISGLARVYLIQILVPEDKLGRAFSSNAFLLYLSNTMSLMLYGTLAYIFSIRFLMIGSGIIIIMVCIIGLIIFPVKPTKFSWRFPINLFK